MTKAGELALREELQRLKGTATIEEAMPAVCTLERVSDEEEIRTCEGETAAALYRRCVVELEAAGRVRVLVAGQHVGYVPREFESAVALGEARLRSSRRAPWSTSRA